MPRAGQQNGAWGLLSSLSQLCMNLGMGQRCESTFRPGAGQEEKLHTVMPFVPLPLSPHCSLGVRLPSQSLGRFSP